MMRACPVCRASSENALLFLKERIDRARYSDYTFSSRKLPEYMNHELLRCRSCDVVFVSAVPAEEELSQAYHTASYDSANEARDAAASYILALDPILAKLDRRRSVLEIGTGTGVFLEMLADVGFETLVGVEPSAEAVAAAGAKARRWIRNGTFKEEDFAPESFDLICCFMTMEHLTQPLEVACAALRLLREGGVFVTVSHDYRSFVNVVLGRRSPVIDVEHMQLFSRNSVCRLFSEAGFRQVTSESFSNCYNLSYWVRLAPFPMAMKSRVLSYLHKSGYGDRKLRLNVGNLICSGTK